MRKKTLRVKQKQQRFSRQPGRAPSSRWSPTFDGSGIRGKLQFALINTLVFCAAVLLSVGFGEALIRLLQAAPEVAFLSEDKFTISANPLRGYEVVPFSKRSDAEHIQGEVNSLGYRDSEHEPESKTRPRVVILGDSVVQGLGIDNRKDVFPALLEQRLRAHGGDAEVINFGVEGYNTQQEVETLKDVGLAFRPDIVILAWNPTDRFWPHHIFYKQLLERERNERVISATRISRQLSWSALYRFLWWRAYPSLLRSRGASPEVSSLCRLIERDNGEQYFKELQTLSEKHGFKAAVVVFPFLSSLDPYHYGPDHLWVSRLSSASSFAYLDLLNDFRKCSAQHELRQGQDPVHPSNAGHACAAQSIAAFLMTEPELAQKLKSPLKGPA